MRKRKTSKWRKAVEGILLDHGDLPHSQAIKHFGKYGAGVRKHFTEPNPKLPEGNMALGATRYSVMKTAVKKSNGMPLRNKAAHGTVKDLSSAIDVIKRAGGVAGAKSRVSQLKAELAPLESGLELVTTALDDLK